MTSLSPSPTPALPSGFRLPSTARATASASCTTAVPSKYGHVDDPTACNAYWSYNPSFAAAVFFCILFGTLTTTHLVQAFVYRKRFTWVLIMGSGWEFGSFIARAIGTRRQQNLGIVVGSQLLFLLAPLWINAFAYMTLGRLINFFHPQRRVYGVKAASITKYFVWADIFSFIVQGTGGSMLNPGNDANTMKIGLKIYMGGVGLQEAFIMIFALLGVKFQIDMQNLEARGEGWPERGSWKMQIWNMYAVLTCITVRIIFRLVEYARGTDPSNPIPYHEGYIYALDALPMFLAILLLNIFHPGRVLVGPDSEFPRMTRKQKKQIKRDKREEKRRKKEGKRGGRRGIGTYESDGAMLRDLNPRGGKKHGDA